jgi:LuxR family transcriptional regulator, maltose regulon positive regulatory protein
VLRNDSAIVRQSNTLRLDLRQCWVDAVAFDRLVERAAGATRPSQTVSSSQVASQALALYRGNFLPDQSDESWTLSTRDRLRETFLRLTVTKGLAIEQQGDLNAATALYEHALQFDNLSENLYRRLIICYRQSGQAAEALKVYRRCREMLSIVLGVQPTEETQALYRTLI